MKKSLFVTLFFYSALCFAQPKKELVTLGYGKKGVALNLKAYFSAEYKKDLIDQLGKAAFDNIIQPRTESDLPLCYKNNTGNNVAPLTMYLVAKYVVLEYDALGLTEQKTTYAIVEVPLNENKDLTGDCKMTNTFYIRIPLSDLVTPLKTIPNKTSYNKVTEPHSLAALEKINVPCDKFTSGIYNGEQTNNQPDGYGSYLFADSSFYCGAFVKGQVSGLGVLYNKTLHTTFIGKWAGGKLTGDYYEIANKSYAININTIKGNESYHRAQLWINEDANRSATLNVLHPFEKEIFTLSNNQSDYGALDVGYIASTKENFFSRGKCFDMYSDRESEVFNMSTHNKYSPDADKQIIEKDLTYSIPSAIYPGTTINIDANYKYFGKTVNNRADGYGNIVSKTNSYRILTSMFSNGKAYGFKQEVYNDKNKFFYAGDFELGASAHSGTFAKINYDNPTSVSISIGSFANDGNETFDKGIFVSLTPTKQAVTFKNTQNNVGTGYIIFPNQNVVYRGGLLNTTANGGGELLQNGKTSKGNFKEGKSTDSMDSIPQWITPNFTDIFNKPFNLIETLQ